MNRRDLIVGLGAAAAWPFAARAQSKGPTIGFLHGSQSETSAAFIQGLRDVGYIDGVTSRVESRTYGTRLDRLSGFADELVRLQCNVILATSAYAIKATMNATSTIPIVGVDLESDPVANGWVKSLSRPGGNLTGQFLALPALPGKAIAHSTN